MLSLETQQSQSSSSFRTKVGVAVAATAAIGVVAAVTLSSTSTVARQTTGLFNIPEDIKGHFSGGQVSGEWTVQGKFHKFENQFGDWQIDSKLTVEGPTMGGQETYTLKNNVLVMVPDERSEAKMMCGDRENLPAYAKWADHLNKASAIAESDMSPNMRYMVKQNCPAGSTSVAVSVDDMPYVICADSTANTRAMYAFNGKFSFSAVSRAGMTVDIEHPTGWEALNCTTFDSSLTRAQAAAKIGKYRDNDDDRALGMREDPKRKSEEWTETEITEEFTTAGDEVTFDSDARDVDYKAPLSDEEEVMDNLEKMLAEIGKNQHTSTVGNVAEGGEVTDDRKPDKEGKSGGQPQGPILNIAEFGVSNGPSAETASQAHEGKNSAGPATGLSGGSSGGSAFTGKNPGATHSTNQLYSGPPVGISLPPTVPPPTASPTTGIPSNWVAGSGKRCAFFHGVGGDGTMHQGLLGRFDHYWGPDRFGKYCSNFYKYLDTNSQLRGYDSLDYHQEICLSLSGDLVDNVLTSYSGTHGGQNAASNTVVFTHSMGGLTTKRAFADGVCGWAGKYYQSQIPSSGSKAANFASGACLALSTFVLGWIIKWTLLGNYCNPFGILAWHGYQTIYNNVPWYPSGGNKAHGRLCGTNPWGLGGTTAIGLKAIQLFSGLQRRNDWCLVPKLACGWRGCRNIGCHVWITCPYNDGMVDRDACAVDHKSSSATITQMGINHADGTGRRGDRSGGAQIDNWFKNRIL